MAKLILIVPVNGCIRYKGVDYLPTSSPFPCDADEAARLIELGVAAPFKTEKAAPVQKQKPTAAEQAAAVKAELLAAIAAAATPEDLEALLPAEEPPADIQEAFAARMAELDAGA